MSVVVASHNEGENLRRTVEGLRATVPAGGEVVVVDDGSTDDSVRGLGAGIRLVRPDARLGAAGARNFGAAHARGEVLVFSDAHVEPPPGWDGPLLDPLRRPDVGAAGPVVSPRGGAGAKGYGFRWRDAALAVEWLGPGGPDPYPVPMLGGFFLAVRRDVFDAAGGFDAGLLVNGAEDAELCLRLWTCGYECLLVPSVEVPHLFRDSFPYPVGWELTLHNRLRVAVVHFGDDRVRRVVAGLATHEAFPAAFARLVAGDAWAVRAAVRATRRFDDDWFFQRFDMNA